MKLTNNVISEGIATARAILGEVCTSEVPEFHEVKLSSARSFWGQCSKNKGHNTLKISTVFEEISDEDKARIRFISMLIHEHIHLLYGCMNHGVNFKKWAALVNAKYPQYNIQRTTSSAEYGVVRERRDVKYIITCQHCGKQFKYRRKPKYDMKKCFCPYCKQSKLVMEEV